MYIILYNSNNDRVYRNPHGEIQMREYQAMAYAKINLGLDVVRRLENGYHQVKMVMQSIGLGDQLTLEMAGCGITITTDAPGLPTDRSNLIHKAASLMFETYGIHSGIRVHLRKEIPMAAGMAGGSTDAAAVMKGINELFRLGLPLFCGILMLTVFHGWYQAHAEPWRTASCLPGWVSRSRLG